MRESMEGIKLVGATATTSSTKCSFQRAAHAPTTFFIATVTVTWFDVHHLENQGI
jgi:hypothetical protein